MELIHRRRGHIPISDIEPKVVNGVKLCCNCEKPLPRGRRKYCDGNCGYEFFVKHNFGLLKFKIFERDNNTCQKCGYKWEPYNAEKESWVEYIKHSYRQTDCIECDHIVPICLGGDEFDENNLQTLCVKCHKKKTKEDMKALAEINRKEKEEKERIKFEEKRAIYCGYWEKIS